MTATTFGAWLARQADRDGPVADLARDFTTSCGCLSCEDAESKLDTMDVARVRELIDEHSGCDGAYEALDRAETEWRGADDDDASRQTFIRSMW